MVDKEQQPDDGQDSLHNTEDTRGKETGVGALDTDALEDGGTVVVDGVDTRAVLPEEEHASEEESPEDLGLPQSAKWLPETSTNLRAVPLDLCITVRNLLDHVDVISREFSDPLQVTERLLTAALGEKPSGRLLNPEDADEKQACGNELNCKRNDPLPVAWGHGLSETIVDPKPDETTNLPAKLVNTNESAADSRWRNLRRRFR